jgi:hypothetical protein
MRLAVLILSVLFTSCSKGNDFYPINGRIEYEFINSKFNSHSISLSKTYSNKRILKNIYSYSDDVLVKKYSMLDNIFYGDYFEYNESQQVQKYMFFSPLITKSTLKSKKIESTYRVTYDEHLNIIEEVGEEPPIMYYRSSIHTSDTILVNDTIKIIIAIGNVPHYVYKFFIKTSDVNDVVEKEINLKLNNVVGIYNIFSKPGRYKFKLVSAKKRVYKFFSINYFKNLLKDYEEEYLPFDIIVR